MTRTILQLLAVAMTVRLLIQGAAAFAAVPAGPVAVSTAVAVDSGTVEFHASTNVAGVDVKGSSKTLTARAEVGAGVEPSAGLAIRRVEASVPIRSLVTGMKMRDEHMRKYIFTTPSGEEPDLRFTSDYAECPSAIGSESTCRLAASLSIRGVTKPFVLNLRVREQGAASFRVTGDGTIKLSEFGIAAPVQLGVRVSDKVAIHLEFTTKPAASVSAGKGGGQ